MNRDRRSQLAGALAQIEAAWEVVKACAGAEREAFDNLPDNVQHSQKALDMEYAADLLDEADDHFEDLEALLRGLIQESAS